jgi:hypothetical protein
MPHARQCSSLEQRRQRWLAVILRAECHERMLIVMFADRRNLLIRVMIMVIYDKNVRYFLKSTFKIIEKIFKFLNKVENYKFIIGSRIGSATLRKLVLDPKLIENSDLDPKPMILDP